MVGCFRVEHWSVRDSNFHIDDVTFLTHHDCLKHYAPVAISIVFLPDHNSLHCNCLSHLFEYSELHNIENIWEYVCICISIRRSLITLDINSRPLSTSFTTRVRQSHTYIVLHYILSPKKVDTYRAPMILSFWSVLKYSDVLLKNDLRKRVEMGLGVFFIVGVEKKETSLLHCRSRTLSLRKTMLSDKKKRLKSLSWCIYWVNGHMYVWDNQQG